MNTTNPSEYSAQATLDFFKTAFESGSIRRGKYYNTSAPIKLLIEHELTDAEKNDVRLIDLSVLDSRIQQQLSKSALPTTISAYANAAKYGIDEFLRWKANPSAFTFNQGRKVKAFTFIYPLPERRSKVRIENIPCDITNEEMEQLYSALLEKIGSLSAVIEESAKEIV